MKSHPIQGHLLSPANLTRTSAALDDANLRFNARTVAVATTFVAISAACLWYSVSCNVCRAMLHVAQQKNALKTAQPYLDCSDCTMIVYRLAVEFERILLINKPKSHTCYVGDISLRIFFVFAHRVCHNSDNVIAVLCRRCMHGVLELSRDA